MDEKEMIHYEDELFEELSKNKIKRTDILTDLNVALQEYQRLAANIKDVREIQEYKIAVVSVESELKELQRENQKLKEQQKKFIDWLDDLNIFGQISVKELIDKYNEIIWK